jgi:hypothetical protein
MLWRVVSATLAVGLALSVQAQAQTPPWLSVTNGYYPRAAECWKQYHDRKIKTFSGMARCSDDGLLTDLRKAGYPSMDLAEWMVSQHEAIAKDVDARKISVVAGRDAWVAVENHLRGEMDKRNAAVQADVARQQAEIQAQLDAQAQAGADAEQRAAMLRLSAGLLAPNRSGTLGESVSNGLAAYGGQMPSYGLPPVINVAPTQTTCYRAGPQVICNTQ